MVVIDEEAVLWLFDLQGALLSKMEGTESLPSPPSFSVENDWLTMYLPSKALFLKKHIYNDSIKLYNLSHITLIDA